MTLLKSFDINAWEAQVNEDIQLKAIELLETGHVLYFPALSFALSEKERECLRPELLKPKSKNISYNSQEHAINGCIDPEGGALKELISRFCHESRALVKQLLPAYQESLAMGKTSFRPAEIAGRKTSYRKDDTRLHVDAFPSNPTQGNRILRVFTNINHEGKSRIWRLGQPLNAVFERFLPQISPPIWGFAHLLKLLGITKNYRTPYDHYMLGVHDRMKGDEQYQATVPYEEIAFPPGSSWMVYTDQVSHAAMSGQHVLEQTFNIPLKSLKFPSSSPFRQMERLLQTTF